MPGWKPALSLRFFRSRAPGNGAGSVLRLPSEQQPHRNSSGLQRNSRGLQRNSRELLGPLALQLSARRRRLWRQQQHQQQQQQAQPAESAASGADRAAAATGDGTAHEPEGGAADSGNPDRNPQTRIASTWRSLTGEQLSDPEVDSTTQQLWATARVGCGRLRTEVFQIQLLWERGVFAELYKSGRTCN